MTQTTTTDLAFRKLVDRYLERVYRYLRNLTRNEDTAKELAHETFLRLRRGLDAGKPPSEAYVFTTARNAALSNWRRSQSENRKRENAATESDKAGGIWCSDDAATSPTQEVERRELRLGLEAALAKLPEDQRSVFLLSEVEGLKYEKIAEIMGIPAGTVASRKHNAARALRAELERMGHALP
jgi:RNA polymerase sigma-70 factor (ECF subfamily)